MSPILHNLCLLIYLAFWYTPWGEKVLAKGVDMLMNEHRVKGVVYLLSVTVIPLIVVAILA